MNNVTYSIAKRKDISDISNLFRNTIQNVNINDYSPQEIEAWSRGAENTENWIRRVDSHHFILARIDDQLVGMASIDVDSYLDVIYVHHEYQGLGIARTLLDHMEDKAQKMGYNFMTSEVSITAKPFFQYKEFEILEPQLVLCRGVVLRNYYVKKTFKTQDSIS